MIATQWPGLAPWANGYQDAVLADAGISITIPSNRSVVAASPTAEFRAGAFDVMVILLTVATQGVRIRFDGTTPTAAIGFLFPVTSTQLPYVFVGERLIRAIRIFSAVAGATVNYAFFWQEKM